MELPILRRRCRRDRRSLPTERLRRGASSHGAGSFVAH